MTCDRHRAERETRDQLCDECVYESAQAKRDQLSEDRERRRLRDRMALQFAMMIFQQSDATEDDWVEIGFEAYAAADAMLAQREETR